MTLATVDPDILSASRGERTPELDLLLTCARLELSAADREHLRVLTRSELDWPRFVRQASAHRLGPLVYHHLQQTLPGTCPAAILDELRAELTQTLAKNMHLAAELRKLTTLLDRHGIPCLAFKGPLLAYTLFGQLGLRPCLDLDLLIHSQDFERTSELLDSAGLRADVALPAAWRSHYLVRYPEMAFYRPVPHTWLDLHWRLLPIGYSFSQALESVWERTREVDLLGAKVTALGETDQLLYLCLHAAKHNWKSLSWLVDVAETVRNQHDFPWNEFLERGAAHGAGRMIGITLRVCQRLLDLPLPPEVQQWVARDPAINALARHVEIALATQDPRVLPPMQMPWTMLLYRAMERGSDRRYLIYDLILQPTSEEWRLFPLPPVLAPLHYFLRPFRLAYRTALRLARRFCGF